jgi:DNA modification methylase
VVNEKIVLNPEDFTQEKSTVWNFPIRGAWATHKPDYRGNFAPQVPRNVILSYSNVGDLVLDPMVGGGTTLIEARLLNRNAVGYDVNQNAVNITSERIRFEVEGNTKQVAKLGNARNLPEKDNSVDLIVVHPPYANIVKYSDGKNPDDLSSIPSLPKFLDALEIAVKEMYRVLKPGRFCAILIGDTRKGQHYIPLSHFVLQRCLRAGFVLKEEVIKTQHNTTHAPRWSASAKHFKFYLIMHEHLFIFRKPFPDENLSRIQYSTWKGVQKAQATEELDDLRGLFDLENKKSKSKK